MSTILPHLLVYLAATWRFGEIFHHCHQESLAWCPMENDTKIIQKRIFKKPLFFYLYPGNCWFGITACFTDQHCVASLLNNFHPRVLDDLRKAIWDFFIWNNIKASKEIWSDVAGSGSDIYIWLLWDCKDKLFIRTCVIVEHILLNFSPIGVNAMIH